MAVVKQGPVTTRIAPIDESGAVNGTSHCVSSREIYDIRPDVRNLKRRPLDHHEHRTFETTVRVKGLDGDRPHFLVQAGALETRVIAIGADGKAIGQSFVIPSEFVYGAEEAQQPSMEMTTMSERGEIVIPARQRAAKDIDGRWNVSVEATDDGWLVRPLGPARNLVRS